MSDNTWDSYVKARAKQEEEEFKRFQNGEEGWYGDYYYVMQGGKMTRVESIFDKDPPYYPD